MPNKKAGLIKKFDSTANMHLDLKFNTSNRNQILSGAVYKFPKISEMIYSTTRNCAK